MSNRKFKAQIKPEPKQDLVYQALWNPGIDTIFFGGGAGGGKTWLICESRLINCYRYPGYKSYIGREELTRLMQSTYLTWCKVCAFHKIPSSDWKLNGQYHYIEFVNGSRIDLLDLKYLPTDPLYERFGSLEYTDGAIDEAGEVNFLAYEVLQTRIGRHKNTELKVHPNTLITGNPKKNWTYRKFFKPWSQGTLPKNIVFVQALYSDNSHIADTYGKQLDLIEDKITKERLKFGNWEYEDDPHAMMNFNAINDLFTNTIQKSSEKYLIVDAARFGTDNTVYTFWRGLECYKIIYRNKQSTEQTEEDIRDYSAQDQIPFSHILIDEDGIGGGIVDHLQGVRGFVANRTPSLDQATGKPQNYRNIKAQCAYVLADKVNNHLIKVSNIDEKVKEMLVADLEQFKVKNPDRDNKKQIVSKEEMKEHLGRSPDFGDCFLMRMWFEVKEVPEEKTYEQKPYEPSSEYEVGYRKDIKVHNLDDSSYEDYEQAPVESINF